MISQAPVAFLFVVIVAMTGAISMVSSRYLDRLATADERRKLADEQIVAYKEKLEGASPDEARRRIDRLESDLRQTRAQAEQDRAARILIEARLAARTLLPESLVEIVQEASAFPGQKFSILMYQYNEESKDLLWQISTAITDAGWILVSQPPPVIVSSFEGIQVQTRLDADASTRSAAERLAQVLQKSTQSVITRATDNVEQTDVVRIAVGSKPI